MGAPFPKIVCSHGDQDPHLTRDSLGPSEPTTETASRLVEPFLHRWLQSVPILYNGTLLPLRITASIGGSGPPCNTRFLGPTQILNVNGIWICLAVFAGLPTVTDRLTEHATRSVTIGRVYVRSTIHVVESIINLNSVTIVWLRWFDDCFDFCGPFLTRAQQ